MQAKDDIVAYINKEKPSIKMYDQLLNLASGALAEVCFVHFTSVLIDYCKLLPLEILKPLLCFRKSSSKRNQISGMNHIGRHLYGNPVLIGELQI